MFPNRGSQRNAIFFTCELTFLGSAPRLVLVDAADNSQKWRPQILPGSQTSCAVQPCCPPPKEREGKTEAPELQSRLDK